MRDLISKIKNSQPTKTGEEAALALANIVMNPTWVSASSLVFGIEEMIDYASNFISYDARIVVHDEELFTIQPIHILHIDESILTDGWKNIWVLLYSNGAVSYGEKEDPNDNLLAVFVDESLIDPANLVEIVLKKDSQ